jgi:5,5'-dehydrodivanillate O-demethylase
VGIRRVTTGVGLLNGDIRDLSTGASPDIPDGELLRRFWYPVATTRELTRENPIRSVRILSEGLVLFMDESGGVGLVQERCTHHGALLCYGYVDVDSLVCPRHGWQFDLEGNCFIRYGEKVYPVGWGKATTYPVERYAGLYWAYLGQLPAPALPRHDVLDRQDGHRSLTVYPIAEEAWLTAPDGRSEAPDHSGSPALLPLSEGQLRLLMPVDDSHTWVVDVAFEPSDGQESVNPAAEDPETTYLDVPLGRLG